MGEQKSQCIQLSGKQTRFLRARGHHLKPAILVGKEGVSPALIEAIIESLEKHELIKIKLLDSCPDERREAAEIISQHTGAAIAQILGRTILAYTPGATPEIILP